MSEIPNPFSTPAPAYETARPAYPAAAVERILNVWHEAHESDSLPATDAGCSPTMGSADDIGEGSGHRPLRVADIGAGTGKMSFLLADYGLDVEAVEPSSAMRNELERLLHRREYRGASGKIRVHSTSAEETGLPNASMDFVVFAQSWHWVREEDAAAEVARILAPGGVVCALWNQLEVSEPWVHRLSRIMRSGDVHHKGSGPGWGECFTPAELECFRWNELVTPEEMCALGTTRSSYLTQDDDGKERMQRNLRWFLYSQLGLTPGCKIALPYSTLVWTSRRVAAE